MQVKLLVGFYMELLYPLGHIILFLLEWWLLGWSIRLWQKSNSVAMIVLPILLASVSYDNLILATGSFIGKGELLQTLSLVRFFLHYVSVPLFIVIGVELAYRAKASWANSTWIRGLSWVIALGLAGTDIVTNYLALNLVPVRAFGILRYVDSHLGKLPIITIAVNVFILLIGIGIWYRLKWSLLFWGAVIAFAGNAVPSSLVGTIVGSFSEFVIAISLLLTERYTQLGHHQGKF
jgi:hypothetical protein